MDSVNFTANHIKDVNIAKRYYNKYKPCKVSLVEFDPTNKKDIDAIDKTTARWDESFTAFTYDDMREVSKNRSLLPDLHVYALTTQTTNFDKIKPSKMLGVIEIVEKYTNGNKVEVLQTNPALIKRNDNKKPRFKHIGEQLVSFIKEKFSDKPLYLNPTLSAIPFYEKQGFKRVPHKEKNNFFWIPSKS